jgi:O-antigen ligase
MEENSRLYKCLSALILILPIAVAGQNIVATLVMISLLMLIVGQGHWVYLILLAKQIKVPLFAAVSFVAISILSTLFNGQNINAELGRFILGNLAWILLPLFTLTAFKARTSCSTQQKRLIIQIFIGVSIFLGIIAISQYLFSWRVVGSSFVKAPMPRARGFYSHPLTFAYVVSLLWPFVLLNLKNRPKSLTSWLAVLGIFSALILSESRTVIAVSILVFLFYVWSQMKGKLRSAVLAAGVLLGVLVMATDNPVSSKIVDTFSEQGVGRHGRYQDDRMVFWHVHYEMLKEKPLLGHGIHLDDEYRQPYYKMIGFGDFEKLYPAHNMYLQVLVEGGVLGFVFFVLWFFWYFYHAWIWRNNDELNFAFLLGWGSLAVSALTQNAFQDSEVKYAMTLMTILFLLVNRDKLTEIDKATH